MKRGGREVISRHSGCVRPHGELWPQFAGRAGERSCLAGQVWNSLYLVRFFRTTVRCRGDYPVGDTKIHDERNTSREIRHLPRRVVSLFVIAASSIRRRYLIGSIKLGKVVATTMVFRPGLGIFMHGRMRRRQSKAPFQKVVDRAEPTLISPPQPSAKMPIIKVRVTERSPSTL